MKEIQEVTTTGITYIDDDGKKSFIDFESCYRNFLALAGNLKMILIY